MRRWVVKAGVIGLEALHCEDVSVPEPGPGEVRIRMHAAALNARDWFVLENGHNRLLDRDLIPLADGAGEIDLLGPGVDGWRVGERVTGLYLPWFRGPPRPDLGMGLGSRDEDGMLAEYVVQPADRLVRLPSRLNWREAATLTCAGVTAWNALYGDHPIGPGSSVLVLGTGGVALFALLFARAAGARVFATSSRAEKLVRLRDLGADDAINYREVPAWGTAVFERTGGVDKVVETGGSGTLNQSIAAVGYGGEVAIMGFKTQGGGDLDTFTLMTRGAHIRGVGVGSAEMHEAMVRAIETRGIVPVIDRTFDFEDAGKAYLRQKSPDIFGKVVIAISEEAKA